MTGAAGFKDHFSGVAGTYAAARPEYHDALFDALAAVVPADACVWEPGCGSGQATRALAARFAQVHATDPSAQQIAQHWSRARLIQPPNPPPSEAPQVAGRPVDRPVERPVERLVERQVQARPSRVTLAIEPGERTSLADASVGLVAVAQALHWFDRGAFFSECERVLVPGGVLAAWGYPDFIIPEGMLEAVSAFRAQIEPHWPPERTQVDAQYAGYEWPFPALPTPPLSLQVEWSFTRLLGYLSSYSASARCLKATGDDPVARHAAALGRAWGAPDDTRLLQWPLFLHLRRKS